MSLGERLISKRRVYVEHLLDRGYVGVGIPQMIQEPNPEHGDGGVVLAGIASDGGCVPDGETDEPLRVGPILGLVEHRPGKTEMGLVPEVLALACLLHQAEAIGEI
jgi:hypothetical protein